MQVNTAVELCAGHKIPTVENKVAKRDGKTKTHASHNCQVNQNLLGCQRRRFREVQAAEEGRQESAGKRLRLR